MEEDSAYMISGLIQMWPIGILVVMIFPSCVIQAREKKSMWSVRSVEVTVCYQGTDLSEI